jgi:hypothetical protein
VPMIGLCSATLAAAGRHGDQADPDLEASQATGRADVVILGLPPHHETDGARLRAARPHLSDPAIAVAARAIGPLAAGRSIVAHGMARRWPRCPSAGQAAGSLDLP